MARHIEKPYGWVFFYAPQEYIETRDIAYAIAGNGPIIVERKTGKMHQLGTATRPEDQIRNWGAEKWRDAHWFFFSRSFSAAPEFPARGGAGIVTTRLNRSLESLRPPAGGPE